LIKSFYIIGKGGQLFYHIDLSREIYEDKGYNQDELVEPSLLSGFISAISDFARQIGEGKIKSMVIASKKWSYFEASKNLIAISISDAMDDDEIIREFFLKPLMVQFVDHYGTTIDNFDGSEETFQNFKRYVNSQLEIFKKNEAKRYNLLMQASLFSLQAAISIYGLENIALFLRHALNYKLILVGDYNLLQKLSNLVQNLAPIQVTTELNEYTDLYPCQISLSELNQQLSSSKYKASIFNLNKKQWINKITNSAELEKKILKETIKKYEKLTDLDRITIFRDKIIEIIDKVPKCIEIIEKYGKHPKLRKEFFDFIRDKDEAEFLIQHIKKSMEIDVENFLRK